MIDFRHLVLNPQHRVRFLWNFTDIVLPTRAVGPGTLLRHAQGLCSSYSSLTCSYSGPVGGQEQPSCSFSERVQEAERPSPLHNPSLGSAHCSEGSEGPSFWAATVCRPTIPVAKDRPATGISIGQGVASSWAWSSGVSIAVIYAAAGWALPSTFARFYI